METARAWAEAETATTEEEAAIGRSTSNSADFLGEGRY